MIKGSWETVCSAFIIHIHHFHSSLILLLPPWILAERVGFEPTERFPVHSISSAANSTTLAPLHQKLNMGRTITFPPKRV